MRFLAAVLLFPFVLSAQTTPPVAVPPDALDLTIRISVNLVQVDAVVTDVKNHPVTNLRANDFEILQDGVLQSITNLSYIKVTNGDTNKPETPSKNAIVPPPQILKPQEVRRVLAFVVDDLGLSFESMAYVRIALKKFVDEQMQPGDLVAILRTGAGIGALQQFTTDKRLLYDAIDRVKFNSLGRVGLSSFTPLHSLNHAVQGGDPTPASAAGSRGGQGSAEAARSVEVTYLAGTLSAVRWVAEGLRDIPGRKSLIFFSESMPMSSDPDVIESLHRLTDEAERSSVVIHTIDPRGILVTGLTPADQTAGLKRAALSTVESRRSSSYLASQDGMSFLARETGGLFIHDLNDIPGSIQQVLDDSSGYYLIGYHPTPGTFDPVTGHRKFHRVKVRVKRAGLIVRTREGFFGFTDSEPAPIQPTREEQMYHALASPFSAGDIHLRLTTLFTPQSKGSFITTFLHADAKEISFHLQSDGSYVGTVDVVAALFGDNGQIVASGDHTYSLRVEPGDYDSVLRNGFIFAERHTVKPPGAYQLRIALRDTSSQKLGSASQFMEVPDLKKGHLALSGILLKNSKEDLQSPALATENGAAESQSAAIDTNGNAAVRIFRPGAKIAYTYEVLNAQYSPHDPPQVIEQVRMFRDGKEFYESAASALDFHGQTDLAYLTAGGLIRLGPQFAPGDYVMQLIITDKQAKNTKYRSVSQWMDFEVE